MNIDIKSKVGDFIIIEKIAGEPKYTDETGTIMQIDENGHLHGTWGSIAIKPGKDIYKTLIKAEKLEKAGIKI